MYFLYLLGSSPRAFRSSEKYCLITTHNGPINVKLRPYQKKIIKDYFNYRFNINAVSRQVGMTTVVALLMLYEAIFNAEKTTLLISNKGAVAAEKMDRIQEIYARVPYFLKPGVTNFSKMSMDFDNGSRLRAMSGLSLAIGYTVDSLFIDDFAHIHPSFIKRVYSAIIPTMTSRQKSRIFLVSSPNGYNEFAKLLFNAERKDGDPQKNMYNANRVYWWEVPNRDEVWKQKEIQCLGSEELFDQEYDLQFFRYKNSK